MSVSITITQTIRSKPKKPDLYQVLLLNDDYTSMEFVVEVLKRFFAKSEQAAQKIMLTIHDSGEGVCGHYSNDIAKTKVAQVLDFARANEQPLKCEIKALEV